MLACEIHHRDYCELTLKGIDRKTLVPICRSCHRAIEFDKHGDKRSLCEANRELDLRMAKTKKLPVVIHSRRLQSSKNWHCGAKKRAPGVVRSVRLAVTKYEPPKHILTKREKKKIRVLTGKQCILCHCWRETAKGDGICATCKRRLAEQNLETALMDEPVASGVMAVAPCNGA